MGRMMVRFIFQPKLLYDSMNLSLGELSQTKQAEEEREREREREIKCAKIKMVPPLSNVSAFEALVGNLL